MGPADRQPLDAALEVRSQVGRLARIGERGRAGQDLFEERAYLYAGKVGAETEVRTVAEHQVRIRMAADVEAVGVGEDSFVAISRGE